MIQILPCPGCNRQTELPESTSRSATIQCPHCDEKYVVAEVLEREFGSWIVVDDPSPHATSVGSPEAAVATESTKLDDEDDALELEPVQPTPEKKKTDWSKFEPITHEQYQRMRRKSRSPFWSVVQVVLGGLAAIPISLLIIWHGLGTDVGNAGPLVGKYVPWVVPEKFRPYEEAGIEIADRATPEKTAPQAGASGFRRFNDVLPMPPDNEAPTERSPTELNTNTKQLPLPEVASEESTVSEGPQASQPNSQETPSENIFELIRKTTSDLEQWQVAVDDASTADMRELALRVYGDFVGLSDAIDALPAENPVHRIVRDQLKPIGKVISSKSDVQNVVIQGAKFWSEKKSRNEGYTLAMIVEIAAVEATADKWLVETAPVSPMKIVIPADLTLSLDVSQRVFLLGRVAEADESAPDLTIFTANYLYPL